MTSIDALNILWDELELYCSKHNDSVIHYWNLLEIIKKDLDILEILKTYSKIQKYYDSFETGDDRQWLEVDLDNSNIQFKKVKEWLTNDK